MSDSSKDIERIRNHYASLKHPPLNFPILDRLDRYSLEFLRAAISQNDEELKTRVIAVTEESYARFPFPSIRDFHHVRLVQHPIYPQVLAAGKAGGTLFAEIGCCIGSEERKLAHDGYPAANIIGVDKSLAYIEAGYKLFRDRDTTPIRFIAADIFAFPLSAPPTPPSPAPGLEGIKDMAPLLGTLTHISIIRVFQLFDEEKQEDLARRLVALLKCKSGAVVFGKQAGFPEAQALQDPPEWKTNRWGHSPASWTRLWKTAFAEAEGAEWAETHVRVQVEMEDASDVNGGAVHNLVWSVEIV